MYDAGQYRAHAFSDINKHKKLISEKIVFSIIVWSVGNTRPSDGSGIMSYHFERQDA